MVSESFARASEVSMSILPGFCIDQNSRVSQISASCELTPSHLRPCRKRR